NVLASLLHSEGVWSATEINAAHSLAVAASTLPEGLRAVLSFAGTGLMPWRLTRARQVAAPVARVLPLAEAPRTSDQLREALSLLCRRIAAEELCELLLLTGVMKLEGLVPVVPSPN